MRIAAGWRGGESRERDRVSAYGCMRPAGDTHCKDGCFVNFDQSKGRLCTYRKGARFLNGRQSGRSPCGRRYRGHMRRAMRARTAWQGMTAYLASGAGLHPSRQRMDSSLKDHEGMTNPATRGMQVRAGSACRGRALGWRKRRASGGVHHVGGTGQRIGSGEDSLQLHERGDRERGPMYLLEDGLDEGRPESLAFFRTR